MFPLHKLKSFLPALPNEAYHYDLFVDVRKIKGGKKSKIDHTSKRIIIFVKSLSPKESATFRKLLKDSFAQNHTYFIEEKKNILLEKLYKYNAADSAKEDNQILNFFKPPILSKRDWSALRDSLFLRSEFHAHNNVTQLKQDIKAQYGERGNVISNLCTAGYFEQTMIPLFNIDQTEFYRYYDLAIDRGITALFVNAGMNIEGIRAEISRILEQARKYGLSSVQIHGIGKKNIQNIKACLGKEKDKSKFTEKDLIMYNNDTLQVMVVDILL